MVIGITKLPTSEPIEILTVLIFLVVSYAGIATKNYTIGLIVGGLLGVYLLIKGRK